MAVRKEETAAKRAQVVELRRQRLRFADIGSQLGISTQRAWKIYQEALLEIPAASIATHRAEESLLADDAIAALLKLAFDSGVTPRTRVEAWNSARGWAEHKARILGMNAATKIEVSEEVRVQILALAAELGTVEPGGTAGIAGDAETRQIEAGPS